MTCTPALYRGVRLGLVQRAAFEGNAGGECGSGVRAPHHGRALSGGLHSGDVLALLSEHAHAGAHDFGRAASSQRGDAPDDMDRGILSVMLARETIGDFDCSSGYMPCEGA
jgi:hypothetical protein